MTTSNTPIYASQARPWLKFYDQKYIDQTMPACTAFELVCRQNKNRLGETALEYYGRTVQVLHLIPFHPILIGTCYSNM